VKPGSNQRWCPSNDALKVFNLSLILEILDPRFYSIVHAMAHRTGMEIHTVDIDWLTPQANYISLADSTNSSNCHSFH